MARRQSFRPDHVKRITNYSPRRLDRQSLPPIFRPQMKSQLRNPRIRPIRPQPATTHMRAITQQKNRPILKPMRLPTLQLAPQSHPHLVIRKWPAKIPRNLNVTPKPPRQRKILLRPPTKPQPLTSQKIRIEQRVAHAHVTGTGTEACTPEPDPCTLSISAPTARNFSTIPSYPRSM